MSKAAAAKELLYWNPAYFIRRGIWLADLNEFEDFFADPICDEVMELFNSEPFPLVEIQFVSSNQKLTINKREACLRQPAISRFEVDHGINNFFRNLKFRRIDNNVLSHMIALQTAKNFATPVALSLYGLRMQLRLIEAYPEFAELGPLIGVAWPRTAAEVKALTGPRILHSVETFGEWETTNIRFRDLPLSVSLKRNVLILDQIVLAFVGVEKHSPLCYPAWLVKILNSNE